MLPHCIIYIHLVDKAEKVIHTDCEHQEPKKNATVMWVELFEHF